jgi:cytochrome c553
MNPRVVRIIAGVAAAATTLALAQHPTGSETNFAPSNLSPRGVQSMAAGCAMCHGTEGRVAPGSSMAGLAGRPKDEVVQAMSAFKSGRKPATIMHQIARGFTDAEVAAIAEYFSRQSRSSGARP